MRDLLNELNSEQKKVVLATHGPVLVLAGAGSGKTRALTYRIAHLVQQEIARPGEILAVTFTNKAAGEMKERVAELLGGKQFAPTALGTFHGICARMLREQAAYTNRSARFTICDTGDSERLIRLAMDGLRISKKDHSPKNIRYRISKAKNDLLKPRDIAANDNRPGADVVTAVYARYEKLLLESDAYDFDDLIGEVIVLLQKNQSVRERYQRLWKWVMVDEYQDTNASQDKLLCLLLGAEQNICVVGDDYQAIYSWRGAKVDHILGFQDRFPKCTTIYLTQNYRSTPAILEAANQTIAQNEEQKHKELWTEEKEGQAVRLVTLPSSRQEATWIREEIEERVSGGGKRSECVILYRTNAQSRSLEEEFLKHGIPYTIVGGFRFYERREIRDALALLQLWVSPRSVLALHRVADALWRGIGPKTISRWDALAQERKVTHLAILKEEMVGKSVLSGVVNAYLSGQEKKLHSVSDILGHLLKTSGYLTWLKKQPDGDDRLENIEELLGVTASYTDADQFLEEVALLSDIDALEEEQDRVTCMSLHASKGLEFDVVFLIGCEEGLLPHQSSFGNPAEIEEERRLLYVGMTRARNRLTLSHVESRFIHGEWLPQMPSRFLEALPKSVEREELSSFIGSGNYSAIDGGGAEALDSFGLLSSNDGEPVTVSVEEGDFVQHSTFGRGVVVGTAGTMVTCVFESHGVKTMMSDSLQTVEEQEV